MPTRNTGDPLNGIYKVLGELEADVRTIKHSQNGASMKLDVIGTVVSQVEDLNNARTDHEKRLHTLEDESQRRQGAVNLFGWLARIGRSREPRRLPAMALRSRSPRGRRW
jgi:hypothetical protein